MLIVSPSADNAMIDVIIESGIDTAMISVARQLPRKSRIMRPVRQAAISASRSTPCTEARTNSDWSATGSIFSDAGTRLRSVGIMFLMSLTISSVDVLPLLLMVSSDARWPFTRTMLVCGWKPSRTCATSRI